MIKKINSSTGNFEDQVTDTIVLDTVPTVNSFNAVTSDGVARAVAGASGEVPVVTENDNGKVLTAIYDAGGPAVEWQAMTVDQTYDAESTNAQSGRAVASAIGTVNAVPSSTSEDAGKVLTVGSLGSPEWDTASGGLPASTSADAGKVLTVDSNGDAGWDTAPSGAFMATYGTTTWSEIWDAQNAGRPVFLYDPQSGVGDNGYLVPLFNMFKSNTATSTYARFITALAANEQYNNHTYTVYEVNGNNVWSTSYKYASHVPDVTSSNANRFLKSYYNGAYDHR